MSVEVVPAERSNRPVLRRLMELYVYDWSELMGWDVDAHGEFGYPYLDHYWTDPDRHAFLLSVAGRWAGFALVRGGDPTEMAEFFVLRRYRRSGVGADAAREVLGRFPGRWRISQLPANPSATAFWRAVIPVEYDEETLDDGKTVQNFSIGPQASATMGS